MRSVAVACLLAVAAQLAVSPAAAEPAACRQPFPAPADLTPRQLRDLAQACPTPAVASLYANRAEHADQLAALALMSGLIRSGAASDQVRLEQCRLFVGLAEAFAARSWRDGDPAGRSAALAELNLAYAQSIHIAERTIRGHDRIVGLPRRLP